jgi:hypothetical protein
MAPNQGEIEIWGDGKQTRSFLYINECLEGTLRLTRSDFTVPVNIGSNETVSIDQLVDVVAGIAGKPASATSTVRRGCAAATLTIGSFARSLAGHHRPCWLMGCTRPTPGSAVKSCEIRGAAMSPWRSRLELNRGHSERVLSSSVSPKFIAPPPGVPPLPLRISQVCVG